MPELATKDAIESPRCSNSSATGCIDQSGAMVTCTLRTRAFSMVSAIVA